MDVLREPFAAEELDQDALVDIGRQAADAERARDGRMHEVGVLPAEHLAQAAEELRHHGLDLLDPAEELQGVRRRVGEALAPERAEQHAERLERVPPQLLRGELRDAAREELAEERLARANDLPLGHCVHALTQPRRVHVEQEELSPHGLWRKGTRAMRRGLCEDLLVERDDLLPDITAVAEFPARLPAEHHPTRDSPVSPVARSQNLDLRSLNDGDGGQMLRCSQFVMVLAATGRSPSGIKRAIAAVAGHEPASAKRAVAPSQAATWLLKSEPQDFSLARLRAERTTRWDGIRSASARANLRGMRINDSALFYHSSAGKETGIVGTVRVVREAYPDPADEKWSCVDIEFVSELDQPLLLRELKQLVQRPEGSAIADMVLFRQSRLSVQPVEAECWDFITSGAALRMIEQHCRQQPSAE